MSGSLTLLIIRRYLLDKSKGKMKRFIIVDMQAMLGSL